MSRQLVVVSAGTYHLPFDRLSEWMQRWKVSRPDVRLIVQHGPSMPVDGAENIPILPYDELLSLCFEADAVVLQGGAGGVMDMRALGIKPIVVPRVPGAGEVVDDHQLVFSAEMEKLGIIIRVTTYDELSAHLAAVLEAGGTRSAAATVATPGAERVRQLMATPIRRLPWPNRLKRMWRSGSAIVRDRFTHSDR